jgi:hypothetical protein
MPRGSDVAGGGAGHQVPVNAGLLLYVFDFDSRLRRVSRDRE